MFFPNGLPFAIAPIRQEKAGWNGSQPAEIDREERPFAAARQAASFVSRKPWRWRTLVGWRIFRKALASI